MNRVYGNYEYDDHLTKRERYTKAVRVASEWWRSLSATEKQAGWHYAYLRLTDAVFVRIPLPYNGRVHVVRIGLWGKDVREVCPSEEQVEKLREIVRVGDTDEVKIVRTHAEITILWKPVLTDDRENDGVGDSSYGFITVS